jgi:hypothetical protein
MSAALSEYPQRNPFPYRGTLSIEGSHRSPESESFFELPPTLPLDPVQNLYDKTQQYLERFRPDSQGLGHVVVLSGDHGSGKTHTINYVKSKFAGGKNESGAAQKSDEAESPLQLYAKADGPDFLKIYEQLMNQAPLVTLRNLGFRCFAALAGEQKGVDHLSKNVGMQAAERFRKDPQQLKALFREYGIEMGAVVERQIKEVERVADGAEDFKQAIYYLLSDNLFYEAYCWLTRQPVSESNMRMLGVSGPLSSPEAAKRGLQLLAAIFHRGGCPLIIYIDQYEKLVLDPDKALSIANAGLLHSLVEVIPQENGMLIISGNKDAWSALKDDLKQRFAFNIIEFPALSLTEAQQMVYLYLHPTMESPPELFPRHFSDADLSPFKIEAVEEIVRFTGGNPRRVLQLCSAVFDKVGATGIADSPFVQKVVKENTTIYFDRVSVGFQIAQLINENSLISVTNFQVQDRSVDFAILDAQQRPRLLVKIREAMFHDSEVREALAELNLVERIRNLGWSASCVFVVLGYVSPQVTETVRQFAPELIVYDPETFSKRFGEALARTRTIIETAANQPPSSPTNQHIEVNVKSPTSAELDSIKMELEKLKASRDAEARSLDERLTQLLQIQAADRLNERRQTARQEWVKEREKIEQQIQAARAKRRQEELGEIKQLHAEAENNRKRKYLFRSVCVFVVAWLIALWRIPLIAEHVPFLERLIYKIDVGNLSLLSLVVAFVYASPLLFRAWNAIGSIMVRELWAPLSSLKDLDLRARRHITRLRLRGVGIEVLLDYYETIFPFLYALPFPLGRRYSLPKLLSHPNPHFRYLGVLKASSLREWELLIEALPVEQSAFIRRAIAKSLAQDPDKAWEYFYKNSYDLLGSVAETIYMVESLSKIGRDLSAPLSFPSPAHELLYDIANVRPGSQTVAALSVARRHPYSDYDGALEAAFEKGFDASSPAALSQISEADVRSALKLLSPIDEVGLGTFDELQCISQIDRLYIFFQQFLFLQERNLIGQPQYTLK